MTNTYLLEVIKALTPDERQEMACFLASPYFNRGKHARAIAQLYQIILAAAPGFSETLLNRERVTALVFPDPDATPGRLEKLIADLNKLLRTFAITQQYLTEKNEARQTIDWARWLRKKGLADTSRKVVEKLKKKRTGGQLESLEQYRIDYLVAEEEHEWQSMHNYFKGDVNIPDFILSLDRYCNNYRVELNNRYLIQQTGAQLPDLESSKFETEHKKTEDFLFQVSSKINDLLRKKAPVVEDFQELMRYLDQRKANFPHDTLAQFYTYLRNTCSMLINAGNNEFIPVLHQIYRENFEQGYFYVDGKIPPNVYLNQVQIALQALEYNWSIEFTETHKDRIMGGDEGRFFYRFNMAQCHFATHKFEEALDILPEAPSNSHYHRMIRRLELQIYYELRSDLLPYKIDAFRKFIVRTATKTISDNLQKMNLNFLNILTQLSQAPLKDKARSERLLARIEKKKKQLAALPWLMEKARELG